MANKQMDEKERKNKKMEIIKKIRREWDWFETTKWLNISTGILFMAGLGLIMFLISSWQNLTNNSRIGLIIMLIGVEGLEFATSKMVKLIRKKNPDNKIQIK